MNKKDLKKQLEGTNGGGVIFHQNEQVLIQKLSIPHPPTSYFLFNCPSPIAALGPALFHFPFFLQIESSTSQNTH